MELASRVFDVVTSPRNVGGAIRKSLPEIEQENKVGYWRRVLRMAALCHDLGHLPFSHAAERDLLPEGWNHERLSREIILSDEMRTIWNKMTPPLRPEDIVKLAVGPRSAPDLGFSTWEAVLAEIIVGDAFGADRIDYLLRDSHHIGVAYGKFDHYRLIDTLRILPSLPATEQEGVPEPALGVEEGGIYSAEALVLARYFMYSQVYFHHIRRAYDIHLKDFLVDWLDGKRFPTDLENHLRITDNEVSAAAWQAAQDPTKPGHESARRIVSHQHFKLLYQRNPADVAVNPAAGQAVFEAACREFGAENVRRDGYTQKGGANDFPVLLRDGRVVSSVSYSETLRNVPLVAVDFVFVAREKLDAAERWLQQNRATLICPQEEKP
jgi:HD superfamily phosphohydrolase